MPSVRRADARWLLGYEKLTASGWVRYPGVVT